MARTYCPNCDAAISVESPRVGDTTKCGDCGEELEIISVNPFEVDFPLDDDWDYDYDDEYEDEDEDDEE